MGISLTSNMANLFQKIIINRLNNHLQFTETQAGTQLRKNTLTNLLALKSVIQQSMIQNQEAYVAFIDLEKAFDKVWSSAIFYPLWKSAVFYLLWRIMHKLNNNQETRVMTKFGLIDTIVIKDSIR